MCRYFKMTGKIIGYGELLLRLTPYEHGALIEQSDSFKTGFAGAEANMLADLALLGHSTAFVTAFPKNPIGRAANLFLQKFGIDTNSIIWNDHRMGTYYIEHGTSIRGTRVTYDRKNSAVATTKLPLKHWEAAFQAASYFVLTGITPALSKICQDNILTALEVAKANQVKIVFDLNFRRTLWSTKAAKPIFETILPMVDVLFANIGSAKDVFGIQTKKIADFDSLKTATQQAAVGLANYGDFESMGLTLRLQESANHNLLGGMIKKEDQYCFSAAIPTEIVDRLGGGDAFAAATLHGLIKNWTAKDIVNFATAAFAATQTIQGDINYLTETELLSIANGNIRGFVKR